MIKKENKIINTISAFLLSLAIVICVAVSALYISVLSQESILATLNKSNYYEGVQKNVLENASDFLIPTGLPGKILDGVFPKEDIEEMVNGQIQGTTSVQNSQLIETKNRTKIKANIDAYLKEIGVAKGEVSEKELDSIMDSLVDEFQKYTSFPFVAQLVRIREIYKMVMWIVLGACFLLGVGMMVFLYKANQRKHVFIRCMAYSFGGAALMLALFPLIMRNMGIYERIKISPQYVYYFCVSHIRKGLDSLIGCGIVAFICMVGFAILSERMRRKLISKQKENELRRRKALKASESEVV